jgi:hypothetical protein
LATSSEEARDPEVAVAWARVWRLFGLKQKRACLAWLALASPAEDFFREHLSTARWFSFFFFSSGRNGQGLVHVQHVFAFAAFFGFF